MRTIVVAPHPDDEVLGPGGTLLRRKAEGAKVAWMIVTNITTESGWSPAKVNQRKAEIEAITAIFSFDSVFQLNFPTTKLDTLPLGDLVASVGNAFSAFEPEEVLLPHASDVHSDHGAVFKAVASCTKWFRYPSIKRVLAYETLSETEFCLGAGSAGFQPNVFFDIEPYLEDKIRAMNIYTSEVGEFPFPRSNEAIRALATLRGATSGFRAAEAFELLRERA
jgi:LmbE family N-acetylglucosaminyl deacetylase